VHSNEESPYGQGEGTLVFHPFRLDPLEQRLWDGNALVPLKPKAFAVLQYLVERPGRLIRHEELLSGVWGDDTHVSEGVLKTQIAEIRQALRDSARAPRFIETSARRGYRFIGQVEEHRPAPHGAEAPASRPVAASVRFEGKHRLVGRQRELELLLERWRFSCTGERQVVFVTGEAGVGKTELVSAFLRELGSLEAEPLILWGQCVDQYGSGEPYLPVIEALRRPCAEPGGEPVADCLRSHAPLWLTAPAVELPPAAQASAAMPDAPERTLRQLAETIEALSRVSAAVLLLEDLHWADYSTLDLLGYLAQRVDRARLLVVATFRPIEAATTRLAELARSLEARRRCLLLPVSPLTRDAVAAYVDRRFPFHELPDDLPELIHRRTEGNPLFMLGVIATWLDRGLLADSGGVCRLQASLQQLSLCVPETFVRLFEHELAAVTPLQRSVLEAASVAGQEFSTATVAAAIEEDTVVVEEICMRWSRKGQYFRNKGKAEWKDGTVAERCEFVHVLYQQITYEQIGAARQALWHRRIGERLEVGYAGEAGSIAPELALHFERGRDHERAVRYLRNSGEAALLQSAYREAVDHLTRALDLIQRLPESEQRMSLELELRVLVLPPLRMTRGHGSAEVEFACTRAIELGKALGRNAQLLALFSGVSGVYLLRRQFATLLATGEDFLQLAEREGDTNAIAVAHISIGCACHHLGRSRLALEHMQRGVAAYTGHLEDTLSGLDLGFAGRHFLAHCWAVTGELDKARAQASRVLREAKATGNPWALAYGLISESIIHALCREPEQALQQVDPLLTLCAQYGFDLFAALGAWSKGAALIERGDFSSAIDTLSRGFEAFEATGARAYSASYVAMIAAAHGKLGEPQRGLELLRTSEARPEPDRRELWDAEYHRVEGELLLQLSQQGVNAGPDEVSTLRAAESCLLRAVEIASWQETKLLELRAATALAGHWSAQGRTAEARSLLARVYGSFSEGFDTPDLREARARLDQLSR
jgi:DNA-binding winged helix-turn-helix (wHTH) protein/tetratricopeptide (TPR) repeat protein/type II secretory pathway predicted ATPase ExeA